MKVLMIQNQVLADIDQTLNRIENIMENYKSEKIDFVILPEMFISPYEIDKFNLYQQNDDSKVIKWLSNLAKTHHAYIIGGSVPEESEESLYNTSYIFNREGKIIKKYRKIHLFKVKYPNGKVFDEEEILKPGEIPGLFPTEFGEMGVMICFDIRFPVLAKKLQENGAKIIFVPAAFNDFTGPLHWTTTFRARAIDNQLFLFGVSPSSNSYGSYETYGHSIAVDPWGKVLKEFSRDEESCLIDIDLSEIDKAREAIPIVKNQKDIN